MSEPRSRAARTLPVSPGVVRWRVADERIGGAESDGYALLSRGRAVLVDPLPLSEAALRRLGRIEAIVLTAACHQRSSWRLRRGLGAPVHAPRRVPVGDRAGELLEEPDARYGDGAALPGGLEALHAPGPALDMYALWQKRLRALFLSDLLTHYGRGPPAFVPSRYQDDPARTRRSVRRLSQRLSPRILCFAHGSPLVGGARRALEQALEADPGPDG